MAQKSLQELTPMEMLERIEERWMELERRDITNFDFKCLMSDVSDYIHAHKTPSTAAPPEES